jgi:hypothetical protein
MEGNRISKIVLCLNLATRPTRRPKSRWQFEVWEDGRNLVEKSGRKNYITERNG